MLHAISHAMSMGTCHVMQHVPHLHAMLSSCYMPRCTHATCHVHGHMPWHAACSILGPRSTFASPGWTRCQVDHVCCALVRPDLRASTPPVGHEPKAPPAEVRGGPHGVVTKLQAPRTSAGGATHTFTLNRASRPTAWHVACELPPLGTQRTSCACQRGV